jgi:hypothetical protein
MLPLIAKILQGRSIFTYCMTQVKVKGKVIPVTGREGT